MITPSRETIKYALCGGANVVFGWGLYKIALLVVAGRYIDLGFVVVSPHIAALCLIVPLTFTAGFVMNRNIVFTRSPLRTRTQLMRYLVAWAGSIALDYVLLKLFVEACGISAMPSQILATMIIAVYSYLVQKYFTFAAGRQGLS